MTNKMPKLCFLISTTILYGIADCSTTQEARIHLIFPFPPKAEQVT